MPKLALSVPSLIQGVSQQPAVLRLPSQAASQENAYPSAVHGLQKRHPFERGTRAIEGGVGDPLVHFIDRDPLERYTVFIGHESIRVYDIQTSEEIPVVGPSGPADFSRLDLDRPTNVSDSTSFLSGANWSPDGESILVVDSVKVGPQGLGVGRVLGTAAGEASGAEYVHTSEVFGTRVRTVSMFVAQGSAASFFLSQRDTANAINHSATFTWVNGRLELFGAFEGAKASIEAFPDGWWRVSVRFQVGYSGGGATDAADPCAIVLGTSDFDAADDRDFIVYGLRQDYQATAEEPFLSAYGRFRALTVADYTFVLDTEQTVAMESAVTAVDPSLRTAFLFVNRGNYSTDYALRLQRSGGSVHNVSTTTWDGTASSVFNIWTLRITAAGTAGTVWNVVILGATASYTVILGDTPTVVRDALRTAINALANVSAAVLGLDSMTITGDYAGQDISPTVTHATGTHVLTNTTPASSPGLSSIQTEDIAVDLATKISALSGFIADTFGSVVRVVSTTDIAIFGATDSVGDTTLAPIWKTTRSVQDLPTICLDGFKLKVVGETDDPADDYYIKFVADTAATFGRGHWEESVGFGITTQLDAETMPWRLVRKQDDGIGTITGNPNGRYFEWAPAVWDERTVGDNDSAPVPSFVGSALADIFFHRNRLGFLSGQNVILSESSRYFNFFRTTVLQLVDNDVIDVSVQHTSVVSLTNAVPANETLFQFTKNLEFRMEGDPILTPKTVQVKPILAYEALEECKPVMSGNGVFFAFRRGSYSGIRELRPSTTVNDEFEADDVSVAVPKYIVGDAITLAYSSLEGVLAILSKGARNTLSLYKTYYESGQKLQSAWFKYTLGARARVLGMSWIESYLYVAVQHDDGVWVEKSRITEGQNDPEAEYTSYLDRRYAAGADSDNPGVYDAEEDKTSWLLGYAPDFGDVLQVVTRNGDSPGTYDNMEWDETHAHASGDWSGESVWIGTQYAARYEFSEVFLRTRAGDQGKTAMAESSLNLLWGRILYSDSAYFRVEIALLGRDLQTAEFEGRRLGTPGDNVGAVGTDSGIFEFGIFAPPNEATVTMVNDSPLPSNLGSIDWEATYTPKNGRSQA